jgi:hypothetical protein
VNFDHFSSWDEHVQELAGIRDRVSVTVPRRKLPEPLEKDAPSARLADAARLIDENVSLSVDDKQYILQHYADALAGKAEAAFGDLEAERKAFVDPQPLWGVYDPELVRKQDQAADAAQSKGMYSREKGYAVDAQWVDPRAVGAPDLNPKREPLTASEEVGRIMAHQNRAVAQEVASVSRAVTDALAQSMGVRAPKATGFVAPEGMDQGEAEKVMRSFFQRYAAGERLAVPQPPKGGHRVVEAPANPDAGKKPEAKDKGKGGKKK